MNDQNKTADVAATVTPDRTEFDGWAVAWISMQPGMHSGYMGRMVGNDAGLVEFLEALEIIVIERVSQDGVARMAHGSPLEFTRELETVSVRYTAMVRLDGLRGQDLALYLQAYKEATQMRTQLKAATPSQLTQVKPSGLVTPGGAPLAGGAR